MITIGCDIHLHCEYRKDGIWYNCDNFEWNQETGKYEFSSIYWGRNYDLFGVLAGVRCSDFETIAYPKGLPDDMALKTKEMADEDFEWSHSHSYLTLRELLIWKEKQKKKWRRLKKKYPIKYDKNEGYYIIDGEVEVTFKYEQKLLNYLIRKIEDKMNDHFFCFEKEDFWKYGEDFRIVFWFDS